MPDLPSGAVTFLFTDIEDGTRPVRTRGRAATGVYCQCADDCLRCAAEVRGASWRIGTRTPAR
jgi:hypothetical protein